MTCLHGCPDLEASFVSPDGTWGRVLQVAIPPAVREYTEMVAHLLPHYQDVALYEFGKYWPGIRPADITWQMVPCGLCDTEVTDL